MKGMLVILWLKCEYEFRHHQKEGQEFTKTG